METYTYKSQIFSDVLGVIEKLVQRKDYSVDTVEIKKEIRENVRYWYVTFHYDRICPHCGKNIDG